MDARIAIVVGNGLTIDLATRHGLWHPSKPLRFPFRMPGNLHWRDALPTLSASLPQHLEGSFDSFEPFATLGAGQNPALDSEVRHFLTLAYSNFDHSVSEQMLLHWPWRKWVRRHLRSIRAIISFNYETVFERAFQLSCGIRLINAGVRHEGDHPRTPALFKPHGSIDLIHAPSMVDIATGYPTTHHLTRNNLPILQCDRDRYLEPRVEGFAVLPGEASPYRDFQWVSPLYENWQKFALSITHFVIAGMSYWECDRAEIDFLIKHLPPRTRIIIANPQPPLVLTSWLQEQGRDFECWTSDLERVF